MCVNLKSDMKLDMRYQRVKTYFFFVSLWSKPHSWIIKESRFFIYLIFLKKVKPSHPYQRVHWDIQYYRASTALNVQEATWSPSVRQGIEHRYYLKKKYKVHTQNRQTRSDIWGNLYLVPSGNPLKETDGRMSSVYLRSTSPCVYVHLCRTELLNK